MESELLGGVWSNGRKVLAWVHGVRCLLCPETLSRPVPCDRMQPSGEGRRLTEQVKAFVGSQQRLLGQFLCQVRLAKPATAQTQQNRSGLLGEEVEGLPVAVLRPTDQGCQLA